MVIISAPYNGVSRCVAKHEPALSHCIELARVDPELLQDRCSETRTHFARDRRNAWAILDTCMTSLAFRLVDDDDHVGLPREFAELTDTIVLIRQGQPLFPRRFSYFFVRMSRGIVDI